MKIEQLDLLELLFTLAAGGVRSGSRRDPRTGSGDWGAGLHWAGPGGSVFPGLVEAPAVSVPGILETPVSFRPDVVHNPLGNKGSPPRFYPL